MIFVARDFGTLQFASPLRFGFPKCNAMGFLARVLVDFLYSSNTNIRELWNSHRDPMTWHHSERCWCESDAIMT